MAFFNILKRKKVPKTEDRKREKETLKKEDQRIRSAPVYAKPATEKQHQVKDKKEEKALKPGSLRVDQSTEGGERLASIILRPRITEKASFITEDGAYTFDCLPNANKIQIKKAIEEIYGVKPVRVNVVKYPPKRVIVRNKPGVKSGGKKAVVYLKEGDRIEFV